jgi:hypothetical protein
MTDYLVFTFTSKSPIGVFRHNPFSYEKINYNSKIDPSRDISSLRCHFTRRSYNFAVYIEDLTNTLSEKDLLLLFRAYRNYRKCYDNIKSIG